jgi:uncharacterized protein YdaU (DUF1376 family)
MLEHGAYTLLLHACYDREKFPTKAEAIDWCWARSPEEITAVEFVLSKFFSLDGEVYVQDRIREEIDNFHAKSEKNKHIALEREAARRTKRARNVDDSSPPDNESPPNQEPRTSNQEPRTKSKSAKAASSGYSPEFEIAWLAYPPRPGASKADAFKAWSARLAEGVGAEVMIEAVKRYAAYCAAMRTEPKYIKQPATFFGPGDHISSNWTAPAGGYAQRPSAHSGFGRVNYSEGINDDGSFS